MKNEQGLQFHLHIKPGEIGRYVLLPGDPGRCEKIAAYFEDAHFVAQNREYVIWTGTLDGEKVSVCSTGIGSPSAAIAIEELVDCGADTLIRVGSAGAMQPDTRMGDLAIITGAIRDEGTSPQYLPIEFPAVANPDVIQALRSAAAGMGVRHHVGITQSKDSFYGEVERNRMPLAAHIEERWKAFIAGGAIASEMESSILFILAALYRKRAGSIVLLINDADLAEKPEDGAKHMAEFDPDLVIRVAVESLKLLIHQDQEG